MLATAAREPARFFYAADASLERTHWCRQQLRSRLCRQVTERGDDKLSKATAARQISILSSSGDRGVFPGTGRPPRVRRGAYSSAAQLAVTAEGSKATRRILRYLGKQSSRNAKAPPRRNSAERSFAVLRPARCRSPTRARSQSPVTKSPSCRDRRWSRNAHE